MAITSFLGSYGDTGGGSLFFRNKIINGGFDIWQRGTSQTSAGYGSDDRWNNGHNGSSKTASRQLFTVGQTDVPGNPKYWARTVVTSLAGTSNFVYKQQLVENVNTFSGQTVTLSFWAKADASKNIAVEFLQSFGTGGSPSSVVTGIGVTTFALTSSWKYFTTTVSIPSISGKVLGSNNDDCVGFQFWFDAGSSFNARTNSLGQQSGTFDIANVQLEAGPQTTPFEQRPIGAELALCQRYCERMDNASGKVASNFCWGIATATTNVNFIMPFAVQKRVVPIASQFLVSGSGTFQAADGVAGFSISALSYTEATSTTTSAGLAGTVSGATQYRSYYLQTVNGQTPYMIFSAEL